MNIVITGASSGLGFSLAKAYAASGVVLALFGRDEARLHETSDICRKNGAIVESFVVDITDAAAMSAALLAFDAQHPVDLIIANAGISAGTGGMDGETVEQAHRIFDVNVGGVLNTLHPLLPAMKARGQGHVAIMASVAGFRGLAGAPAYSASKGAARMYGEGIRAEWARFGIAVSVICPGFIKTPMTDVNDFPMPFLMEADAAAVRIVRGLKRKKARIAFPWPVYLFMRLMAVLPVTWGDALFGFLPKKP